jgi:hypothetical protein
LLIENTSVLYSPLFMKNITFLLKVNDYNYYIFTENGVYLSQNLFSLIKGNISHFIINDIFIKSAIKINNFLVDFYI